MQKKRLYNATNEFFNDFCLSIGEGISKNVIEF